MKKEGFPPLIDENTKVLALGTMPGDRSILTGEYYANPTNQFWKIIFRAFNSGESVLGYKNKTELFLKNRIGPRSSAFSTRGKETVHSSDLKHKKLER